MHEALVIEFRGRRIIDLRMDRNLVTLGTERSNDVVLHGPDITPVAAAVSRGSDGALWLERYGEPSSEVLLQPDEPHVFGEYKVYIEAARVSAAEGAHSTRTWGSAEGTDQGAVTLNVGSHSLTLKPGQSVTIGRDPNADLTIDDDTVSSTHARVEYASGAWVLQDLGSRNGTFMNGVRVGEARLKGAALFTLGAARVDVVVGLGVVRPPPSVRIGRRRAGLSSPDSRRRGDRTTRRSRVDHRRIGRGQRAGGKSDS